jgi:cellulose synthase/poly-beta-1,6-N-acetylglucosamine synthase-like glycosyltransferase
MNLPVLMLGFLLVWPLYNVALSLIGSRTPRPDPAVRTRQLCFWIVVPALDEELVIADTVRSLLALDTPWAPGHSSSSRGPAPPPLRVLVVDDGSTDRTVDVLQAIGDDRLTVLRRHPPNARQGKGPALNAAFRLIRDVARREGTLGRTVLGVIDADGRASADMLTEVSRYLADPFVGAVQCRVRIRNRRRGLGLLQDIEFGCVADSAQTLRDLIGTVALSGNGQFTMLPELLRFGDDPWSSCLVEDVELALRLHRAGVRIRYAKRATVSQQAVTDLRRLVRQRGRWAQGNLQCLRHVPGLMGSRRVSGLGLLDFMHYLLAPWLVPVVSVLALVILGMTIGGRLGWLDSDPLTAGPAELPAAWAMWVAALQLPGIVWGVTHRLRLRDEPLHRCLRIALNYPLFLLLGAVASCWGMARYFTRRDGWAKTERLVEIPASPTEEYRGA